MNDEDAAVYADQLEQRGEIDRANLIRLQRVRAPAWERESVEARWECEHLIARFGDAWRAELPVIPDVEWREFREGFIASAFVGSFETLHDRAAVIGAVSPTMSEIVIAQRQEPDELAPPMPWLRTLRMQLDFTDGPIVIASEGSVVERVPELVLEMSRYALGQGPMLPPQLTTPKDRFAMVGEHIGGQMLANELVANPGLHHTKQLELGTKFVDFNYHYFGDPTLREVGAQVLANGEMFRDVELLDLTRQRIGDAGFAAIAPQLGCVRELLLGVNDLTTLPALPPGPMLDRLDVYYNRVKLDFSAARLAGLKELVLDTCELRQLSDLVTAPCWSRLRILDLSRNELGELGRLATRPPHLHTLRLANCDLDPGAIAELATLPWLEQLIELSLDHAPITPALLARLGHVKSLSLASCTGAIDGVWNAIHLDLSETDCMLPDHAPNLQTLVLRGATFDVDRLIPAAFPRLRTLDVSEVPLSGKLGRILDLAPQLHTLLLRKCELDHDRDLFTLAERGVGAMQVLDLRRQPKWTLESYVQLARSEPLRAVKQLMLAPAWSFAQHAELDARFGAGWAWRYEDEQTTDDEGA